MAEEADPQPPPPTYLEVRCRSSGKIRRFAVGSEAGFALSVINRKADVGSPIALYLEAVKEGEEAINFGPNSTLVDYGNGWKLQTVTEADYGGVLKDEGFRATKTPSVPNFHGSDPTKRSSKSVINAAYVGKIVLVFIIMFILGGFFTLALESLPQLLSLIKSS